MVTDHQIKKLWRLLNEGGTLTMGAMKAGMARKTARKYRDQGKLPSEMKSEHRWRTRRDPFEELWPWVAEQLGEFPGLEAKTLFEVLQRESPGRFSDGQLRTLQRRVKIWRATEGPGREVMFPQKHYPGELCASDFTRMGSLGITIGGDLFDHLLYHFVLTYSNWEDVSICFSESYESLSFGFQNALWRLGGVPKRHRTDSLSSAINNLNEAEEFTRRYKALLNHYRMDGQKTQGGEAHENGDAEQSHHRFKRAIDQALMLRGDRDFVDRASYESFLRETLAQRNAGRHARLNEEMEALAELPPRRLEDAKKFHPRVGPSSTIRVQHNVYSVHSRLIRERVEVRLYADYLDVWYAQRRVERLPRLRGEDKHRIDYRHIIEWLVRKPGAFANYRYKSDLFPTSRFRIAYDMLKTQSPARADKEYLKILYLAAQEGEAAVNVALGLLQEAGGRIDHTTIEQELDSVRNGQKAQDPHIADVDLRLYDELCAGVEEAS